MLDKGRLEGFSIFSGVPQDKLSANAQMCDLLELKPDEVIFQQGETPSSLLPECPTLWTGSFTATAKCSTNTRVFTLSGDDLKAMNDQDPALGYLNMEKLAEVISQRLQNRTDKLIETWGECFEVDRV